MSKTKEYILKNNIKISKALIGGQSIVLDISPTSNSQFSLKFSKKEFEGFYDYMTDCKEALEKQYKYCEAI